MTARTDRRLVAVIGASGTVGAPLVAQLAGQIGVRLILRRPAEMPPSTEVTTALADFGSVTHLARAMAGADSLFVGIGTTPDLPRIEGKIIDAARLAGVQRIVRISAPAAPEVAVSAWHGEVEARLAQSGVPHVNIRPTAFMQNWLRQSTPIRLTGRIVGSAGNGARNHVDARDVAAVAVRAILDDEAPAQRVQEVLGPDAFSHTEMAERLSFVTGDWIRYVDLTPDAHLRHLTGRAGMPGWLAHHVLELDARARATPEQGSDMLRGLLGRAPRTMDEFLAEQRDAFLRPRMLRSWFTRLPARGAAGVPVPSRA